MSAATIARPVHKVQLRSMPSFISLFSALYNCPLTNMAGVGNKVMVVKTIWSCIISPLDVQFSLNSDHFGSVQTHFHRTRAYGSPKRVATHLHRNTLCKTKYSARSYLPSRICSVLLARERFPFFPNFLFRWCFFYRCKITSHVRNDAESLFV